MPPAPPRRPPPLPGVPQRYHDSDRVRLVAEPAPAAAKPVTAHPAPPDAVHVGWRGVSLAVPMSLVTALVTALVTHWATPATLPASDELRAQVREIAADMREVKHDHREMTDALAVERAYTRRDIPLIVSVLEKGCSAKFAWHDGRRPAEPDWLPPPLNGAAPQWQPAEALLPPPTD